jgi:YHS domain-containing protein
LTGKAAKADQFVSVNGKTTFFCCSNCKGKFSRELAAVADTGKCPISGKAVNPSTQVVHTKREVKYFCCNNCKGKYAKANFK